MKKPLRLLLLLAGGFVLLLAVLIGLAFTPSVQTWAVRRAVAGLPGVRIELGRVAIGLNSVHVENLRITQPGLLLAVPSADIELPVIAAARGQIRIVKLIAKDWSLDLTPAGASTGAPVGSGATGPNPAVVVAAAAAGVVRPPAAAFDGIFHALQLPIDLSLDAVELAGDVTRPDGHVHLVVTGGNLGPGRDASFVVNAGFTSVGAAALISSLTVQGTLSAHLDSARSFSKVTFVADATGAGPQLAQNVPAHLDVEAARDALGEHYRLAFATGGKDLVHLVFALPAAAGEPLTGTWMLDASDHDLAPLALGRALPMIKAAGQGTFSVSRDFREVTTVGKLTGQTDLLSDPRLGLGQDMKGLPTGFSADFNVVQHGDLIRVTTLEASVGGAQPVVEVRALQGFEFNAATRELKVADPAVDLLQVALADVPLSLARSFLPPGLVINGGTLSTVLRVGARNAGFAVRSVQPLVLDHLALAQAGGWSLADSTLTLTPAADYSPQGWQLEVTEGTVRSKDATLCTFSSRVGQAAGQGEAIKATGSLVVDFPSLAGQPAAGALGSFVHGTGTIAYTAVLGDKSGLDLKLDLKNLTAADQTKLADLTLEARVDVAADGGVSLNVPATVSQDGRISALALGGTIGPVRNGVRAVDLKLKSDLLHLADVLPFFSGGGGQAAPTHAAVGSSFPSVKIPAAAPVPTGAPWAGFTGNVKYEFKQVVFSPDWQASLQGSVTADPGTVSLNGSGILGADAPFTVTTNLTYAAGGAPAYALKADVKLTNFDTAPLLRTVEGRADFHAQLSSQATVPAGLADGLLCKVEVTSKGGVCRLLAVTDDNSGLVQSAAGTGASLLGGLVGAIAGNKAGANAATAITQIAGLLREIRYDQLNLTVSRDAQQNIVLDDFNLISPQVRLAGHGQVRHVDGQPILAQPLTLQLAVAARDSLGTAMSAVGLLAPTPDNLGYQPLVLDLPELGGTLQKPDTNAFYKALVKSAEKKATDAITNEVKKNAGSLLKGLLGK